MSGLMFRSELADAVLGGRKTQTRRRMNDNPRSPWFREKCGRRPGRTYAIVKGRGVHQVGRVEILSAHRERLGDITEQAALAEGFDGREAFLEAWKRINRGLDPDEVVWVLHFKLAASASDTTVRETRRSPAPPAPRPDGQKGETSRSRLRAPSSGELLRVYEPEECTEPGPGSGYPQEWSRCFGCLRAGCERCEGAGSIKDLIRQRAGQRCVRCLHPYWKGHHGNGEWSSCDDRCRHGGPARYLKDDGTWTSEQMPSLDGLRMLVPLRQVQARWRILTVHHLNEVKRDCRWWNLAALCQRCHLNVQRRVKIERPWPYEHSDWFKPYVAGYNAATMLGEELSPEEVEVRLPELLELVDRQDRLPGLAA